MQLPAKKDFHLFILAGQSNMAGRGKVDDEAKTPQVRHARLILTATAAALIPPSEAREGDAADLIGSRRDGQKITYFLNTTVAEDLLALFLDLFQTKPAKGGEPC